MRPAALALLAAALAMARPAAAIDTSRHDVRLFAAEVASRHHLDRAWVLDLLAQAEFKDSIVDAMNRPAEKVRPWYEYQKSFITDKRIREGREFYTAHRATFDEVAAKTGVPATLLVAILGVESSYGRIVGPFREIDALATLAFDYPERGAYFRGQLEQFLLLAREAHIDPLAAMGSYGGAMGAPQFMPGNVRRFAVDADGDGKIDLYSNWNDIAASVANFLLAHGWQVGEPLYANAQVADPDREDLENGLALNTTVGELAEAGVTIDRHMPAATPALFIALREPDAPSYRVGFHNFWVLTRYNRSAMYALAVCELAEAIANPPEPTAAAHAP
jgi:membrane-bound lytic murein transglycosylase B